MKKVVVMSLGGSIIIPDKVNIAYLEKFKRLLRSMYRTHKFVIVCGGGSIARKYIEALRKDGKSEFEQSQAGCRATRMNALLLMQIFGKEANDVLPANIKDVADALKKNSVVICGALRYAPHSTSDGTSAKVAHHLGTDFINVTNIKGLYTANPKVDRKAEFIPNVNWKDFERMALSMKYKSGQHFVLDQEAAAIIRKYRIPTFIVSENIANLKRLISGKSFIGTTIEG